MAMALAIGACFEEKVFVDELQGTRRGIMWLHGWLVPVKEKGFQVAGIQILRHVS